MNTVVMLTSEIFPIHSDRSFKFCTVWLMFGLDEGYQHI